MKVAMIIIHNWLNQLIMMIYKSQKIWHLYTKIHIDNLQTNLLKKLLIHDQLEKNICKLASKNNNRISLNKHK